MKSDFARMRALYVGVTLALAMAFAGCGGGGSGADGVGLTLVDSVNATSVVDSSVAFNVEYCYQVFGYDFAGHLISATEEACIVA